MPEYSSTTITPADGVQTPAMNGSTSGNYTLAELRNFILASKGLANGLASLDANGKLPLSQLPDLADDVIVVASYAVLPATGTAGKLYITADNNKGYRWDPDLATPAYVLLFNPADIDMILRIISGAQVVGKATADGNGNNIVDTYATKTALQEEVEAREAADQSLSEALETYETTNDLRVAANSQDIQNIQNALSGTVIQEHVDSTQKNVKTILSADELLPWAILKRVGARSTVFRQIIARSHTQEYGGVTMNISATGRISFTGLCTGFTIFALASPQKNHKYLVSQKIIVNTYGKYLEQDEYGSIANAETILSYDANSNTNAFYIVFQTGETADLVLDLDIYDLTAMGLDSITASEFHQLFPAYTYPFDNGSLIELPPLSFLYRGTNQWDEEWEVGSLDESNGGEATDPTRIRSKNYIRVIPDTTYYALGYIKVLEYDSGKNYIGVLGWKYNNAFTTSNNTGYIKFYVDNSYGTTYNNDMMICLNSVTDKTYKPFIGQTIDTSFMAGKKYVNSSCYDYAENVYVNGILKRKNQTVVGMIELDGSLDESYSAWSSERYTFSVADFISPATTVVANILCNRLITVDKSHVEQGNYQISGMDANVHEMMIHITSAITDVSALRTWLSQNPLKIYFELDTLPDPTYGDPIPNFPCEDGSTIMANTPQTEIVNAIDVPSTIGYSTKIA